MRRAEREITDRAEMEDILRRAEIVNIAMVDAGEPYVVPMNFGYAAGAIYVHGALAGRRASVLAAKARVCFEVYVDYELKRGEDACAFSSKFRSVIGYGKAVFLSGRDEKVAGLDILMSKFAKPPFVYNDKALEKTAVIRIDIESMTGKKLGY